MRKIHIALTGVAVIVAAGSLYLLLRRETPDSVGRELLDCAKRLDSACLHRRMTLTEREDARATIENLNKFMSTVVGPRLAGFVPVGEPKAELQLDGRQAIVSQRMMHLDGRTVVMAFSVSQTEDGVYCDGLIRQLLMPCVISTLAPSQPAPRGPLYASLWAECLEAWTPDLDASGVLGATMVNEVGLHEVFLWSDMIKKFREASKPKPASAQD